MRIPQSFLVGSPPQNIFFTSRPRAALARLPSLVAAVVAGDHVAPQPLQLEQLVQLVAAAAAGMNCIKIGLPGKTDSQ